MSTAVEQSLQIALQEPAAAIAVAVLFGGGLVGMSIRTIVESVVIDEETGGSDDSERGAEDSTARTPERADSRSESESDPDPEELENRLDTLENEVGSLSSTVDNVRAENEQISESVDEVEANTGRLVSLFRRAMGSSTSGSASEPAKPEQTPVDGSETAKAVSHDAAQADPETDETQQERETEVISESLLGGGEETDSPAVEDDEPSSPGVREKHCVDSDEEIIDAPGRTGTESADDSGQVAEEVEEIGTGTFEGTRFSTPDTTTETFGIEETITTVASDGGTAIASESDSTAGLSAEQAPPEPETPSVEETDSVEEETESDVRRAETETQELEFAEPETAEIPDQSTPATAPSAGAESSGKPYLESLPAGFGAEVLTVEWLEFLVEAVGIRETARALEYYQTIGWLTEDAAADLEEYLDGLEPGDRADLSAEHHLKTLEYVEELTASEQADGSEDIA